jgi:hypothetical protein
MRCLVITVVLLTVAGSLELAGQTVVTLGQRGGILNIYPFQFSQFGGRYQHVWGAHELNITPGSRLVEVRVWVNNGAVPEFLDLRLRVAHTGVGLRGLSPSFDGNYTGFALEPFLGPVNYTPPLANGYARFPATTPFIYDGTNNLLLDWSYSFRVNQSWAVNSTSDIRNRVYVDGGDYQTATGVAAGNGDWEVQFVFQVVPGIQVIAGQGNWELVETGDQGPGYLGVPAAEFELESYGILGAELHSVTLRAGGSGNDATDYAEVALWYDADHDGLFDAGIDLLMQGHPGFPADDGELTFHIPQVHQALPLNSRKRFIIVVKMSGLGAPGATFDFRVQSVVVNAGTYVTGLTAVFTHGVRITDNLLVCVPYGPHVAAPVNNDSDGYFGDGELLFTFAVSSATQTWTVSDLTFEAIGTGHHHSAFNELALYQDNGNGLWDGAQVDLLAAAKVPGFDTSDQASFNLNFQTFAPGVTRRFYLVGKLSGTARTGETLNARLLSVNANCALPGLVRGVPTPSSTALVIAAASMTIANAPHAPAATLRKSGSVFAHVLGKFLLTATNDDFAVNGITFTTEGSASWASELDPFIGVQVYLDDGNYEFSSVADPLLFEGPGSPQSVHASFTPPLVVPNSGSVTIWLVVNGTVQTGSMAISAPITFGARIADVAAVGTKVFGTPAPETETLGVIHFTVTRFNPIRDLPTGGASITMEGSGFLSPLTVRIGGETCLGSPVITDGTRVTGLVVPRGAVGTGITIEIDSGTLSTQTLSQTFTYGASSGDSEESGCTTRHGTTLAFWLMSSALMLLTLWRRRPGLLLREV